MTCRVTTIGPVVVFECDRGVCHACQRRRHERVCTGCGARICKPCSRRFVRPERVLCPTCAEKARAEANHA
jgi:hypothetical protein